MPPSRAALAKDRKRLRELRRAQTDLYWLACKLGYEWSPVAQQGVTEHLHGPMCARMDSLRDHPRVGTIMPRGTLKTSVFTICLAVQEILRDPDITIMVNHAVEEEAENILQEVGQHFRHNEWLRSLDPVGIYPEGHRLAGEAYRVMPLKSNKKFLKAGAFTIRRAGHKPSTKRQPTMRAKGAGAEITGAHCDMIFPDDITGEKTIEEATGKARLRSWWQKTVLNVLNPGGRVRYVATPWDHDDSTAEFRNNPEWDIVVRHARETDGKIDYKGLPIHYGPTPDGGDGIKEAIKREETALNEMGQMAYALQRMCDPVPPSELPWPPGFSGFISLKEAAGPGTIFVLGDPAPWKIGGFKGLSEKKRGDGTKDYWSFAVVKLRVNGTRQEVILLDGSHSQEWDIDPGCDEACRLMKKWGTNKFFTEDPNTYFEPMRAAARRNGVSLMQARKYSVARGGLFSWR